MIKLTPVLAVAVAVVFTSGSPAAVAQGFAQTGASASSSTASSYSPPVTEHKKKPKKPKKGASAPAASSNGQTQ